MSERVYFAVDDGESAIRIEAVLACLGFEPVRDLCVMDGEPFEQASAAAAWRYRLSQLERDALTLLLRGRSRGDLAEQLGVSAPTLTFHLHNLHHKLGVHADEQAVRRVLHLEQGAQRLSLGGAREAIEALGSSIEAVLVHRSGPACARLEHAWREAKALHFISPSTPKAS